MLGLAYLSLAKNKNYLGIPLMRQSKILLIIHFCVLMEELELSSNMVKRQLIIGIYQIGRKDASIHKMIVRDCVDFSGVKISKNIKS